VRFCEGALICVAHLVRKANGPDQLRAFVESYGRYSAGVDHELVLLMKGFADEEDARVAAAPAKGLFSQLLLLPDAGYDIGAYSTAANDLEYESFCFLNSFSRVRGNEWLAKMSAALGGRVRLVGASGSFGSHLSWVLLHFGLGAYRTAFTRVPGAQRSLEKYRQTIGDRRSWPRRALDASRQLVPYVLAFESFPSHHIRTNAFLMPRDAFRAILGKEIRTKADAWKFESSRRSLTRRVESSGYEAVVVGLHGDVHARQSWAESETFWQGQQKNLLVGDNQTAEYEMGDYDRRIFLSVCAWGQAANPAPPRRGGSRESGRAAAGWLQ
jgi:hypothetical protein